MLFLALIEEASKAICYALTTLIWPIITFLLNISFVILGILVLVYYSTLVKIQSFEFKNAFLLIYSG